VKALVVDDEPLARRELRRLLAGFPWVQVVGEAANVDEAQAKVAELAPQLLFLDIHMPGGDGFELLDRLDDVPRVIFTTAYDHHAVRAFEVNALDYLLKPIEPERLGAALARVHGHDVAPLSVAAAAPLEQLFVRDGERCWLVPLREVRLIASEGNYARLYWNTLQPLVLRSLVSLEPRLDGRFFRANRQQLISLDFVESVDLGAGGRLHVQLRGGPEVEISRRQARLFKRSR
jgi:two-component system LytT family response regulator